jgi:hypothetical protein
VRVLAGFKGAIGCWTTSCPSASSSEDKKARASVTKCVSAPLGVLGSEAGENFFLLSNLPGKQKTDRPKKEKVSRCVMQRKFLVPLVGAMQSWHPTPHVVSPREKAIERCA